MTIVRYVHRNKRPPRKKAQAPEITGPLIVKRDGATGAPSSETQPEPVIVTARKPRGGSGRDAPDLTPEELQRRRDAADALFREVVRRARE
jgi:hypothetical protein